MKLIGTLELAGYEKDSIKATPISKKVIKVIAKENKELDLVEKEYCLKLYGNVTTDDVKEIKFKNGLLCLYVEEKEYSDYEIG